MAITPQTTVVQAPWNTADISNGFEAAFVNAGLGTFHDSFVSGSARNSIQKVVYDPNKTLGAAYHWFQFIGQEIFLSVATAWDAVNHVPIGTPFRDYISTVTNAQSHHYRLAELNSNADVSITVYRSGVDPTFSWFYVRCGTVSFNFHIPKTGPDARFFDLDKDFYHPIIFCRAERSLKSTTITFARFPLRLRSSGCAGEGLRGSITLSNYGVNSTNTLPWNIANRDVMQAYNITGNSDGASAGEQNSSFLRPGLILPIRFSQNTYYSADKNAISHSLRILPFSDHFMPTDFGVVGYYKLPNVGELDQYVNGSQRWDVISCPTNVANPVDDKQATGLFMALRNN